MNWRANLSKRRGDDPIVARYKAGNLAQNIAIKVRQDGRTRDPRATTLLRDTLDAGRACGLIGSYRGDLDSGNLAEARRWHDKLFPLCRDMLSLSTNPIPIKAAMKMLGRDTGELRMPMTPLSTDQEAKLRATLTDYGLL